MVEGLSWAAMAVGLFWAVHIGFRRPRSVPDLWLGAFLAVLAVSEGGGALDLEALTPLNFGLALGLFVLQLVQPPLLYHYVRSASGLGFRKVQWFHYLPALVVLVLLGASLVFLVTTGFKFPPSNRSTPGTGELPSLFDLQKALYLVPVFLVIQNHQRRVKAEYSDGAHRSLRWLVLTLAGAIVLWLAILSVKLANHTWADLIDPLGALVFFYVLGWCGLRQSPLPQPSEKYGRSGMTPQDEALVSERLGKLMADQKAFVKEDLSLGDVAEAVRCSPHWISQFINGSLGLTFFDYVNGLRVGEFIRMAQEPGGRDRTILDLATDAGFRSKSTFNAAFRKKTGTTPGEWRKTVGI